MALPRHHINLGAALASLAVAADRPRTGFLSPGGFDVVPVLEPAPVRGDPRYDTDRRISRATRALRGTPHCDLPMGDPDCRGLALMDELSCAAGVQLTPTPHPGSPRWCRRRAPTAAGRVPMPRTSSIATAPSRSTASRCARPEPICSTGARRYELRLPIGSRHLGTAWALVLTAAVPERAQQILTHGRSCRTSPCFRSRPRTARCATA